MGEGSGAGRREALNQRGCLSACYAAGGAGCEGDYVVRCRVGSDRPLSIHAYVCAAMNDIELVCRVAPDGHMDVELGARLPRCISIILYTTVRCLT